MRAVVTGCAGFIGSHLTERLLDSGWSVLGIDCFAPTYDTASRRSLTASMSRESSFEFVEGDVNDMDLVPPIAEADVVFHLAARPGVRASWVDFDNASRANVLATQRVADAVSKHPGTRLVFASSSSVYGRASTFPTPEETPLAPISPYGVTKATGEALIGAYVSQFGIDAVSLRYFTVYGPRQRSDMAFTRWIRAGLRDTPLPIYGDGTAIRDFTFVEDVVDATIAASSMTASGHHILNVAGGSPATVNEVLGIISDLLNIPVRFDNLPTAKGDPDRTGGSTDRLVAMTGWEAKWTLVDGLAAQIEWLRGAEGA